MFTVSTPATPLEGMFHFKQSCEDNHEIIAIWAFLSGLTVSVTPPENYKVA